MKEDGLDRNREPKSPRKKEKPRILDPKFWRYTWSYIFQCFLATATVVAVLLILDYTRQAAIVASIGASAFIVFTSPSSQPARFRSLIGGYTVGMIAGIACTFLGRSIDPLAPCGWMGSPIVMGGVAVGLSIFLMVLTDTEHPPAAAIALALVINRWNGVSLMVIGIAIGMLVLVRYTFKNHLRDLI